jgi:hypothetical protein
MCRKLIKPVRGRPPTYCSAACRQKAYRERPVFARLVQRDLDKNAVTHRHVRALEVLGYEVSLKRRTTPVPVRTPPHLELVQSTAEKTPPDQQVRTK